MTAKRGDLRLYFAADVRKMIDKSTAEARRNERQRIRQQHLAGLPHRGAFHIICCLDRPADLLDGDDDG